MEYPFMVTWDSHMAGGSLQAQDPNGIPWVRVRRVHLEVLLRREDAPTAHSRPT